jgi:hypothetical protein
MAKKRISMRKIVVEEEDSVCQLIHVLEMSKSTISCYINILKRT